MYLLILAVIGVAVFAWWTFKNALFTVSIVDGRVASTSGTVPPRFLGDVSDIVRSPPVRSATIRASRDAQGARLRFSGDISESQAQRLRNVFRLTSSAQFTSGDSPFTWSNFWRASIVASLLSWILPKGR